MIVYWLATVFVLYQIRIQHAFWKFEVALLFFLATILGNYLPILGGWGHKAALLISIAGLSYLFYRACRSFQKPTPLDIKRLLEKSSNLTHRPFDALEDTQASQNPETRYFWEHYQQQIRSSVQNLKFPSLGAKIFDPYAIRFLAVLSLLIGLVMGWGHYEKHFGQAFSFDRTEPDRPPFTAWITPPSYTNQAPLILSRDTPTIHVPFASFVTVHLPHSSRKPSLFNAGVVDRFIKNPNDFYVRSLLHKNGKIMIRQGKKSIAQWNVKLIQDQSPTIEWRDDKSLSFQAKDDYGLARIEMHLTPEWDATLPPLVKKITTHGIQDQLWEQTLTLDEFLAHPWAGLPVQVRLMVEDRFLQQSWSTPRSRTLPTLNFQHPVAKILITERQQLVLGQDKARESSAEKLEQIVPSDFQDNITVYLAIRIAIARLHNPLDSLSHIQNLLWDTANHLDGHRFENRRRLYALQQRLRELLYKADSGADFEQTLEALRDAFQQLMQNIPESTNAPTGNVQDVEAMLQQIQALAKAGFWDQAQDLLSRLEDMLENLQFYAENKSFKQIQDLQEISDQQKSLLEKNDDPQKRAKEQEELFQKMQDFLSSLSQPNETLQQAAEHMKQAAQKMNTGQSAKDLQKNAVAALQNAITKFLSQLKIHKARNGRDPFGRKPYLQRMDIPTADKIQRVRIIQQELRRRSDETDRPSKEQNYIKRLLKKF